MRYLALLLIVGISFGAEGGHIEHSFGVLLWKGLNILAFLGIVYYFGRKPISEAFNRFYSSIIQSLTDSEKELLSAREELLKAKEELEEAKRRAEESVAFAKETAESEKKKILRHAEEVAQRIREKARESVEIELNRAKKELALYGIQKAEEIAVEILKQEFSKKEIQEKYIEAQLKVLEGKNA